MRALLAAEPRHPHAWRLLGDALSVAGDADGAADAYLRQVEAAAGDPEVREAAMALAANRLDEAEPRLRSILRARPTEVAAIRMLAELAIRIERLADAEALLDRALELAPGFDPARYNRAVARHRRGRAALALEDIDRLLSGAPDNLGYRATRAAILSRTGDYEAAIADYDAVLAHEGPGKDARLWMSRGHALKTVGRREACVASYRHAVELTPSLGEAWWSLANLKTHRFTPDDIAQMERALEDASAGDADKMHLHFALGQAIQTMDRAEDSFVHYAQANAMRRAQLPYDADATSAHVDAVRRLFDAAAVAAREGLGDPSDAPIFILGLPRSGSTLLEQILATHPEVEGTMELPDITTIAGELEAATAPSPDGYSGRLLQLDADELASLGRRYLDQTRIHRREGARYFIDKMPNNWMHVPLIHLILPNARIIDARRHPLDCGFSCFTQHFARGQGFAYDLADIGRYYADYTRLMDHVDEVLPGRVHRVFHERLIAEPEAEIRALLAACGLPFDPVCLEFHRNDRPVRTASAEQVRRPLSSEGVGRWRMFDPWLDPLRRALGPALKSYPD
ncbi:MAG: sulfotransferase [Alphaproteobacteria bacterium]|nr:sulfotransferase [Alphaproteobacteria bacterium]MBU1515198.1 sulfotransferase [Alphaproteobacteria bacterium]MBU2092328.1 sulfotransferase [Alphaproteobacteria bacterium]MBU2152922.1 sulfotransferase [Alphaproteobacteria bacterium]MBU2305753.1 sulfotransferase [Alphaproteobacteria bacterium]